MTATELPDGLYIKWMRCPVDRRIGTDRTLLSTALTGKDKTAELGLTPTLERGIYPVEWDTPGSHSTTPNRVPVAGLTQLSQERTNIKLD